MEACINSWRPVGVFLILDSSCLRLESSELSTWLSLLAALRLSLRASTVDFSLAFAAATAAPRSEAPDQGRSAAADDGRTMGSSPR